MWPEGPWGRAGWGSKASRGRKVLRTGRRGVSRADRSCVSPSTSEGQAGVAGAECWPGPLGTGGMGDARAASGPQAGGRATYPPIWAPTKWEYVLGVFQ